MLRRPRSRSFLIGAILLLLPFVLYWQVWWPDARLRQVFQYGDFVEQHYPMRVFVADEYRHGRLPLWDPYTFSGEPAVAMSLFAPYYPPGFWQVIFPKLPFEALEIEAILPPGAGRAVHLPVRASPDRQRWRRADRRAGVLTGRLPHLLPDAPAHHPGDGGLAAGRAVAAGHRVGAAVVGRGWLWPARSSGSAFWPGIRRPSSTSLMWRRRISCFAPCA